MDLSDRDFLEACAADNQTQNLTELSPPVVKKPNKESQENGKGLGNMGKITVLRGVM